jgi:hypothetical protein
MRLYRNTKDLTRWFAFGTEIGWVTFPPEAGGWQKRQLARDLDLVELREVPLRMGFNTGIPGAPSFRNSASGLRFLAVAWSFVR